MEFEEHQSQAVVEYFSNNNSWFLGNHCGPRQGSLACLQIPMLVLLRISRSAMLC